MPKMDDLIKKHGLEESITTEQDFNEIQTHFEKDLEKLDSLIRKTGLKKPDKTKELAGIIEKCLAINNTLKTEFILEKDLKKTDQDDQETD